MLIVLSSWPQGHCESSLGSFDECSAQAAVDPQTKPHDLGCESACRMLSSTITIAIYYYLCIQSRPISCYRCGWCLGCIAFDKLLWWIASGTVAIDPGHIPRPKLWSVLQVVLAFPGVCSPDDVLLMLLQLLLIRIARQHLDCSCFLC